MDRAEGAAGAEAAAAGGPPRRPRSRRRSAPAAPTTRTRASSRASTAPATRPTGSSSPRAPAPARTPSSCSSTAGACSRRRAYRAWLEHLAKKGNVVVFPKYQASVLTLPSAFTGNAIAAVKDALAELALPGHAVVDLARAGVTGHSFGGVLAANLAARAAADGLPTMRAVLCAEPGTGGFPTYENYALIPAGTLLLAVVGNDDATVGDADAKRIFAQATAVPLADKDFVRLYTDGHGTPALSADHSAAGCGTTPDAYDWRGFWKWFDALLDAAFTGQDRASCLGNTPAQRDLGRWSDGVPVTEPLVTDAP